MSGTERSSERVASRRGRSHRQASHWALSTDAGSMAGWQSIWFELRQYQWRSLAIVPVGELVLTVDVAAAMAAVARRFEGAEAQAVDATRVTIDGFRSTADEISIFTQRGGKAIVAVANPLEAPVAIPLVRSMDEAVLLVPLEHSLIRGARATVFRVGQEKFIGAMVLRPRRRRRGRRGNVADGGSVICEPAWSVSRATPAVETEVATKSEPSGRPA